MACMPVRLQCGGKPGWAVSPSASGMGHKSWRRAGLPQAISAEERRAPWRARNEPRWLSPVNTTAVSCPGSLTPPV